ncbi:DNA cytosine methyltransferase [Acinetobacter calcoaceticus]|uniref:DNA cytosine methyltransferase n=1 Tax=Acinetobacter calcoaceticus TaxID=471 RepID=UPI001D0CED6B|nr:DNA cytosine methyltransferase [Acinetobacter calcoaceticus]
MSFIVKKKVSLVKAIDLFCGAGGLTHGLINSGIDVIAGYDIEESCKFAYEYNNKAQFITKDITTLDSKEINKLLQNSPYTLLAGCAPCQPFSTYARSSKQRLTGKDHRWDLLTSFGQIVSEVKPDFVTMENVPGLAEEQVFKDFLSLLVKYDYNIDFQLIFCPDYGMAQTRKRLVLVASRICPIFLPQPTHSPASYQTVYDVIGHLPPIIAGQIHPEDPLHRSSALSDINLKRIKASKPGGTWLDWPVDLRANCHKKISGITYPSVYGRMSWDEPAPTITTQCNGYGNGRFGHPEQDRAISLREAAIIQSFPDTYQFTSPKEKSPGIVSLAKMIGNAVPVRLGEIVGQSILLALKNMQKN